MALRPDKPIAALGPHRFPAAKPQWEIQKNARRTPLSGPGGLAGPRPEGAEEGSPGNALGTLAVADPKPWRGGIIPSGAAALDGAGGIKKEAGAPRKAPTFPRQQNCLPKPKRGG